MAARRATLLRRSLVANPGDLVALDAARRLHVGAWQHGVSLYGWEPGRDAGFAARHPELDSGKGTLRLTRAAAQDLPDDELRDLLRAALDA